MIWNRSTRGFTLVETIIALGVLGLMIVVVVAIFNNPFSTAKSQSEANKVMEISREVANAAERSVAMCKLQHSAFSAGVSFDLSKLTTSSYCSSLSAVPDLSLASGVTWTLELESYSKFGSASLYDAVLAAKGISQKVCDSVNREVGITSAASNADPNAALDAAKPIQCVQNTTSGKYEVISLVLTDVSAGGGGGGGGGGGCTYVISTGSQSVAVAGASYTVNVTAGAGCAWTATSNQGWASITAGSSGTGNGSVSYTVAANAGGARNATLTIGGQSLAVSQSGASGTHTLTFLGDQPTEVRAASDGSLIGTFTVPNSTMSVPSGTSIYLVGDGFWRGDPDHGDFTNSNLCGGGTCVGTSTGSYYACDLGETAQGYDLLTTPPFVVSSDMDVWHAGYDDFCY